MSKIENLDRRLFGLGMMIGAAGVSGTNQDTYFRT